MLSIVGTEIIKEKMKNSNEKNVNETICLGISLSRPNRSILDKSVFDNMVWKCMHYFLKKKHQSRGPER